MAALKPSWEDTKPYSSMSNIWGLQWYHLWALVGLDKLSPTAILPVAHVTSLSWPVFLS